MKQARNILVAVGGRAVKPPIDGAEHAMTSDEILEIEEVRRRCTHFCFPILFAFQL